MTESEAVLQQARAAVGAGRWHDGLELLSGPGAPAGAEALDLLGRAAYGAGRLELSISCREQLYRLHLDAGQAVAAAGAAATVALELAVRTALVAPGRRSPGRWPRPIPAAGRCGSWGERPRVRSGPPSTRRARTRARSAGPGQAPP